MSPTPCGITFGDGVSGRYHAYTAIMVGGDPYDAVRSHVSADARELASSLPPAKCGW